MDDKEQTAFFVMYAASHLWGVLAICGIPHVAFGIFWLGVVCLILSVIVFVGSWFICERITR